MTTLRRPPTARILVGDCRDVLQTLPDRSVQTVTTSPPYFGLRSYTDDEELKAQEVGTEPTPDEFVQALVAVFREVRRVLRDDGTVWLNLGDSYNAYNGGAGPSSKLSQIASAQRPQLETGYGLRWKGAKPKDLIGVPWMVAFALRADGWYLRSDIIWNKPNPMPESVTDRPTKAHEYLFLLSKQPRYFYDADAIREADSGQDHSYRNVLDGQPSLEPTNGLRTTHGGLRTVEGRNGLGRNKRSVWTVATQPYSGAHFATFPPKLIEPCILAGTPPKACGECGAPWTRVVERERGDTEATARPKRTAGMDSRKSTLSLGGNGSKEWAERGTATRTVGWEPSCAHRDDTGRSVVLDPFAGAGTTGVVAGQLQRDFVGIELNPRYAEMARQRIALEGRPGGKPPTHQPNTTGDDQLRLLG